MEQPAWSSAWRAPPRSAVSSNATEQGLRSQRQRCVAQRRIEDGGAPGAYPPTSSAVSSAGVYGEPSEEKLPFGEKLALEPVTPYGASKAAMEVLCGSYARGRGLRIATIRAFNQLGPGQSPVFAASGFARQIAAAEAAGAGRVELAVGNLAAARDFTDVRDTARAFVAASRQRLAGAYNLCSGAPLKLEALVEEMAKATPLPLEVVPDPSLTRPADPSTVYGNPARLREASAEHPDSPFPVGRRPARLVARRRLATAPVCGRPEYPPGDGEQDRQASRGGGPPHDRAAGRPRRRAGLHRLRDRDRPPLRRVRRRPRPAGERLGEPAVPPFTRAASTRGCTGIGSGRCASTPATPAPRRPTSASAT